MRGWDLQRRNKHHNTNSGNSNRDVFRRVVPSWSYALSNMKNIKAAYLAAAILMGLSIGVQLPIGDDRAEANASQAFGNSSPTTSKLREVNDITSELSKNVPSIQAKSALSQNIASDDADDESNTSTYDPDECGGEAKPEWKEYRNGKYPCIWEMEGTTFTTDVIDDDPKISGEYGFTYDLFSSYRYSALDYDIDISFHNLSNHVIQNGKIAIFQSGKIKLSQNVNYLRAENTQSITVAIDKAGVKPNIPVTMAYKEPDTTKWYHSEPIEIYVREGSKYIDPSGVNGTKKKININARQVQKRNKCAKVKVKTNINTRGKIVYKIGNKKRVKHIKTTGGKTKVYCVYKWKQQPRGKKAQSVKIVLNNKNAKLTTKRTMLRRG